MNESTLLLHYTDRRDEFAGAINPPVFHASLFAFNTYQEFLDAQRNENHSPVYSRHFNPTVNALERKIAALEHTDTAIAFSSGMGAITAPLLALLRQGDHLLVVDSVYGPARQFCSQTLTRLGVQVEFFSAAETDNLGPRLRPNTRYIYLESPGSLTFDIQNLRAVAELAKSRGIITMADNSWATPLFQNPARFGIDIVVHSGSKYIAGHSDITLGLLACSTEKFDQIKPTAALLGANLSPADAYLALRGLRTLFVRLDHHQRSALQIAEWLSHRPEVRQVLHPGLTSFPGHQLAKQQMSGYSSLFSFRLHPGTEKARHAFVDALGLFLIGVSWGGYESLILPLTTAYADDSEWRLRRGLDDDIFRTSIGLEDPTDLIRDLEQGFAAWRAALD